MSIGRVSGFFDFLRGVKMVVVDPALVEKAISGDHDARMKLLVEYYLIIQRFKRECKAAARKAQASGVSSPLNPEIPTFEEILKSLEETSKSLAKQSARAAMESHPNPRTETPKRD
jgi:hypothetical protein